MRNVRNVGLHCRGFFERALCLKPKRGPWSRVQRPMRHSFDCFCVFHGRNCLNYTVGQTGRAIYTATIAI